MTARLAPLVCALLVLASPALAAPASPAAGPVPAPVTVLTGASSAAEAMPLDRGAIFEILCGGMTVVDPGLKAHLWQVAGSLAAKGWTPPAVTVRVVVRTLPR